MVMTDSPARRVLGDKTTNAPVRKQSPTKPTKSRDASQPGLQTYTPVSQCSPVKAGLKRSIEEVEDAERVDAQDSDFQRSTGTQALSLLSDSDEEASWRDRSSNNASISFSQSQSGPEPVETTFEIVEEGMSQTTRDSLNAVPLPQNASQPTGLRPMLLQNLSQISAGMSSFVDFDQSQQDELKPIEAPSKTVEPTTEEAKNAKAQPADREPTEDESRAQQLRKAAEQLRTRLRLAHYKVTTNQITVPFSRLRAPTSRPKSPESTYQHHHHQQVSSSPPSSPNMPHRPSPETRIAIMRARAAMQAKRPISALDTVYMPSIAPTAFSARHQATAEDGPGPAEISTSVFAVAEEADSDPTLPSSPPQSRHTSTDGADETPRPIARSVDLGRKAGEGEEVPQTPVQLSSPPGSPEKGRGRRREAGGVERGSVGKMKQLTSSVIKGNAAKGLMMMMTGS